MERGGWGDNVKFFETGVYKTQLAFLISFSSNWFNHFAKLKHIIYSFAAFVTILGLIMKNFLRI